MDTKAQDLKLSLPPGDVHTSQARISLLTHQEKGAFPLAVQWKFKRAGSRRSRYVTLISSISDSKARH